MDIKERAVRYLLKMECKRCGGSLFSDEDAARDEVEGIFATQEVRDESLGEDLRAAMSFAEHEGRYCDYCTHVLNKDD
jgi:hypothetical protein